jgi:hypothetical protein
MATLTPAPLRIIGVHGVGHWESGRSPEELRTALRADWAENLAAGSPIAPLPFDLDIAYYAHLLNNGHIAQGPASDELDDPLARSMLADWLDELGAPEPVMQGSLTLPLRHTAAWVATRFSLDGRLTGLFIRIFFAEVARFLRAADEPMRLAAREEVADRIAEHRATVVVAHSLGSIVAYEALHAHPELAVDLLLTIGSPLALPKAVFDRLIPGPARADTERRAFGVRPPGVQRWVNIADPGDPVAIPPHLARSFHGINNGDDVTESVHHSYGFHLARNYLLGCPEDLGH